MGSVYIRFLFTRQALFRNDRARFYEVLAEMLNLVYAYHEHVNKSIVAPLSLSLPRIFFSLFANTQICKPHA